MAIARWEPGFNSLARRMNEFINEFDKGFGIEIGGFAPRVDISEDETHYYFHAELPGLKKEDVKVSLSEDNILTIKGEKKREEKFEDKKEDKVFIRTERNYGNFTRTFMLPNNVKKDNINAKYEDGILEITLDKIEPQKPREFQLILNK